MRTDTCTTLLNAGSRSPGDARLWHFTTSADNTKEGNSGNTHVDIGAHYLALVNGQPADTDGDGIPDLIEDRNGNGAVDTAVVNGNAVPTESDWTVANSGNGAIVYPTDGSTGLNGPIELLVSLPANAASFNSIGVLIDNQALPCSTTINDPAQSTGVIEVDTTALADGVHSFSLYSHQDNGDLTVYSDASVSLSVANSVKIPEWQTVVQNLLNINMQTAYPNQHYSIWWWDKHYPKLYPDAVLGNALRIDYVQGSSQLLTTDPVNGSISFSDSPANYGMSSDRAGAIYTCIQIATDGSSFPYTASITKDPQIRLDPPWPDTGQWAASYCNDPYEVSFARGWSDNVWDPHIPGSQVPWIHTLLLNMWLAIGSSAQCGPTLVDLPAPGLPQSVF